jgi:hypothetical protein
MKRLMFVPAAWGAALATLCFAAIATAGSSPGGHSASFDRCHQLVNLLAVPKKNVENRVGHFTVRSDDGLTAVLQVKPLTCGSVTAGGTVLATHAKAAMVGVEVETPSGTEHPSDTINGDFYLLFFVTDSEPLAKWLRAGTGLEVEYVPGIAYSFAPPTPGLAPFFFEAPEPARAPFKVEGVAGAQNVEGRDADVNWWQDTKTPDGKQWTVKLAHPRHTNFIAPADVTITAPPESELAKIMGTSTAKPFLTLSERIDHFDELKTVTRK